MIETQATTVAICWCGKRAKEHGLCENCTIKLRWLRKELGVDTVPETLRVITDSSLYFTVEQVAKPLEVSIGTVLIICRELKIEARRNGRGMLNDPYLSRWDVPKVVQGILLYKLQQGLPSESDQAEKLPGDLISTRDLMDLLGVGRETIRQYVLQEYLKPHQFGTGHMWRKSQVLQLRTQVLDGRIKVSGDAKRKMCQAAKDHPE